MASLALAFDILARDKGASKTFDKVGDSAERAGRRGSLVGPMIRKSMGIIGPAIAAAGAGMLAAGGAAAIFGVKTAAANEQAMISFTTMLGSAQKAGAFIKDLQKFAAETPFDLPGLQQAASSLISAGINADKVIPIMRTLGDVTSGMGTGAEGVQRATIALQQMNAAGKITGEDLNQLRDAGIPVYDLLSKATGKSKAEVVKLAQAGKLGSKELGQMMKALESGKGLERFSGLMDKQSQSLTGLWSTFKDTLGQGLANAVQPLIPLLKGGLGGAAKFLGDVLPKASKALSVFIGAMTGQSELNEFDGKLKSINNAGILVNEWGRKAIPAIKGFVAEFKNGTGAGGQFRDVLTRVVQIVRAVVTNGVALVKWMREHQKTTLAAAAAVAALVAITRIHAAVMAVQSAGGILQMIKATKIITALTRTWAAVQWLINAALIDNPIGIVVVALAALVAGTIYAYKHSETFRNIVQGAFKAVGQAASFMWDSVIKPVFRFIINAWMTVAGAIINGAASAFGWVPGLGPKLKAAAAKFNEFRDSVNAALNGTQNTYTLHVITPGMRETINSIATLRYQIDHIPKSVTVGVMNKQIQARALGGPVSAGMPYIVGEHRPELFVPNTGGRIVPRVPTEDGTVDLSRASIEALGREIQRRPTVAQISAGSVDRALAAGMR